MVSTNFLRCRDSVYKLENCIPNPHTHQELARKKPGGLVATWVWIKIILSRATIRFGVDQSDP